MPNDWSRSLSPSLGPGTRGLLAAVGLLGIVGAVSARGSGSVFAALACVHEGVLRGEAWRLFTASLLTAPQLTHLLFTLLVLYMFAPTVEGRWGTRRFVTFLALVSAGSFGIETVASALVPGFGSAMNYGPGLIVAGLTAAWGRENPRAEIRLFFVLPVRGSSMVWVTIAFAVLGLVYPGDVPEGSLGILAAALLGVGLAGSPSPLRIAWLRIRLVWLDLLGKRVRLTDSPRGSAKGRASLRAISGGRETDTPRPGGRWLN